MRDQRSEVRGQRSGIGDEELEMAHSGRKTARMPAMKFPRLRKRLSSAKMPAEKTTRGPKRFAGRKRPG
jgi:hypothetical protein